MFKRLMTRIIEKLPIFLWPFIVVFLSLYAYRKLIVVTPVDGMWRASNGYSSLFVSSPKNALMLNSPIIHFEEYFEVQEGDIVLDVGACLGLNTIHYSNKVGEKGLVISIETDPKNLKCLRANIQERKLCNVKVVGKAVWNKKCKLKLNLSHNILSHSLMTSSHKCVEVKADTLDNIVSDIGINKVNFVKINIEGAEFKCLQGAPHVLDIANRIVVEASHKVGGVKTAHSIYRFLEMRGFFVQVSPEDYVYAKRL